LDYQQVGNILCIEQGLDLVDFALVCDAENPVCRDPSFSFIDKHNYKHYLAPLISAAQYSNRHGSLFVFNSQREMFAYIGRNMHKYTVFPSFQRLKQGGYIYYDIHNTVFYPYAQKHGGLPIFEGPAHLKTWACNFYLCESKDRLPVGLHLRNNPSIQSSRNSDLPCWFEFVKWCEIQYPVVQFILVGARSEDFESKFASCKNVIVTKKRNTNMEEDLALYQNTSFCLGTLSGPCQLSVYNVCPYFFTRSHFNTAWYSGAEEKDGYIKLKFCLPSQVLYRGNETLELLKTQFERMFHTIDIKKWWLQASEQAKLGQVTHWLR